MDINNPVVKLCIAGSQAEFEKKFDQARRLYLQAWEAAQDNFEACIAAHYVARLQEQPEDRLYWNTIALKRADMVDREQVQPFYASLYLNMGHSYEILGRQQEAEQYYNLAASLGINHQPE